MPEPEPGAEDKGSFLPCFLTSAFSVPPFPRQALWQGRGWGSGARLEAPGLLPATLLPRGLFPFLSWPCRVPGSPPAL